MMVSEERAVSVEELLSNINSRKETKKKETKEKKTVNKIEHASKNSHAGMIVFVLLIAALGVMIIMLKAEVMTLKTEVGDFRHLRAQIAESDPKIRIALIENKLEDSLKEKEALKNELTQIKKTLEEIKNTRVEKKRFAHR
ncbi:MAG: hypothetical protein EHM45_24305 [Desulfobacteraceae bacterium]|nr:MAG: hypothetical protein EHM45_24305 [Desulfobacteraceae bacterium]